MYSTCILVEACAAVHSCFQNTDDAQLMLQPLYELLVAIIHHCRMCGVQGCRPLRGSPPLELLHSDPSVTRLLDTMHCVLLTGL